MNQFKSVYNYNIKTGDVSTGKTITFKLPAEEDRLLRQLAKEEYRSVASMVFRIIVMHFDTINKKQEEITL